MTKEPPVYVAHVGQMNGLMSGESFEPGDEVLNIANGKFTEERTRTSIEVFRNFHIEHDVGKFINHSCDPNTEIMGMKFIAIKPIAKGDEITFDYTKNETEIAHPFECACCGKMIEKS